MERKFLEQGVHAMQRVSGQPRYETDSYLITSLEIIIDRDRRLGSGGYGEVFEGDWHGSRIAVKVLDRGLPESVRPLALPYTSSTVTDGVCAAGYAGAGKLEASKAPAYTRVLWRVPTG